MFLDIFEILALIMYQKVKKEVQRCVLCITFVVSYSDVNTSSISVMNMEIFEFRISVGCLKRCGQG